jgi:GT2 family glycosyltransferase
VAASPKNGSPKLSIVILCWNDRDIITECIRSIYAHTKSTDFEIIVSDNGSTDGSPAFIRSIFPLVKVIENKVNLRFSQGNNAGIEVAQGELILILNPDTLIHDRAIDQLVEFASSHPEAGAFGCRVLNADGSYQGPARPFPTVWREWLAALYLRSLGYLSDLFISDRYVRWHGETERAIDWQSGCCQMFRGDLLRQLKGFDPRFYYYYEDVDLCHRVWDAGYRILYTPSATITHLGGLSTTTRCRLPFELDKYRNRYRYFYKYFGKSGARRIRRVTLTWLSLRYFGYSCRRLVDRGSAVRERVELYKAAIHWNKSVDPVRLVEEGHEPIVDLGKAVTSLT